MRYTISFSLSPDGTVVVTHSDKRNRDFKGKSRVDVVSDYTVLDIETTGLDTTFDNIIEVSAVRIRQGLAVDAFTALVKPEEPIDNFISELTGITNEMLETAPPISEVLPKFFHFIADDTVIGHNVNFDVNFLYDQAVDLELPPFKNDFIDTMRLARRLFPELPNHKLGTLADFFRIEQNTVHRAAADCEVTNIVYQRICEHISANSIDLAALFAKKKYKASDIHAQTEKFDEDSPFLGKVCVFTGALERMARHEAMQIVANMGGICGDNVTAKTNYLILGNNDYCASIKNGKSNKQRKAESLILKGKDLIIISEDVFYDMISTT